MSGLTRNSNAPRFMACTVAWMSARALMKMIGMSVRSATSFCSSRPLDPGSYQNHALHRGEPAVLGAAACRDTHQSDDEDDHERA